MRERGHGGEQRAPGPPTRGPTTKADVLAAADAAAAALPVWPPPGEGGPMPPFVPRPDESFVAAGLRLARIQGARLTLPRARYMEALEAGDFGAFEIDLALRRLEGELPGHLTPARVIARMDVPETEPASFRIPTVLDLVGRVARLDWRRLVLDRLTRFCADRFDQGAASWGGSASGEDAWQAFRAELCIDRSFELRGLTGCRRRFAALPEDGDELLLEVAVGIGVPRAGLETWCERLLADVAGWHGLERWYHDAPGVPARQLLPLRAVFELLLYERYVGSGAGSGLALGWDAARLRLIEDDNDRWRLHRAVDHVLQVAAEIGAERRLTASLAQPAAPLEGRPEVQLLCCTDVREERLRRALEQEAPTIETVGTVGDFGLPAALTRSAAREPDLRARLLDALVAMRTGGVSAFAHVEALGLLFAPRLLRDALGLRAVRAGQPSPPGLEALVPEECVDAAERVLRDCSLLSGFAPLVVLLGHGAASVGDPHAVHLQCHACEGRASDAAATSGARLLNDAAVRAGLAERGIEVPADTHFVAALHDTTRDELRILERGTVPESHGAAVTAFEQAFVAAARRVRAERAAALGLPGRGAGVRLRRRSRDYSVVRAEQGQAGCSAFLAAPRRLTRGLELASGCHLHSYDPERDPDGATLARVLGRSLVLAARSTLQYHLAAVDPEHFGAGDRTLVDLVGGVGVLEGNDGALRVGLPLQLVHDGRRLAHRPTRLDARVMASTDAIDAVLATDAELRLLVDAGWITLRALDASGRASHRYVPRSGWLCLASDTPPSTENAA
ncbi:MAG: putative inorganic carbon transporter subunit DabA [Pseudomonadales bacterium]|nr:putative inorganic carbon transporter subunit DabA [Pseudomonadales bacterium]